MPTKFIAEVSSNHKRDFNRCCDFIKKASDIGCDAVKFQSFKIEKLFSKEILSNSEEHRNRKNWELPDEYIEPLSIYAKNLNIDFACTPFDLEAVKNLEKFVSFYKIASYELLWDDLLIECAKTGLPVYLSTGMANMKEIYNAVEILKKYGCNNPQLMHCVSSYPAPLNECNLSAIKTIREATSCPVGWSDHSNNKLVLERAIHHWNADSIEFHLDLDGKGDEFSPGHCWLPNMMESIISSYKLSLNADGNGIKAPSPSEIDDREWRADPSDGFRPRIHLRKNFQYKKKQS